MAELSRRPSADEIQSLTHDVAESVNQGIEACDELDLLISVTEKAVNLSDLYRNKRNYAKKKLTELVMRL